MGKVETFNEQLEVEENFLFNKCKQLKAESMIKSPNIDYENN